MQIDAATATVIGAFVGAGVAGIIGLVGQWFARRSEERRQLRQLVIQAAVENWKLAAGKGGELYPLDSFILHMLKLVEVLELRHLTPETVRQKLREVHSVSRAATDEIEKFSADFSKRATDSPATTP
jgi:hypothetical protein